MPDLASKDRYLGLFIGFALILSVSSKLRLGELPVGIGELLILSFIFFTLFLTNIKISINNNLKLLFLLLVMIVGSLIAVSKGTFRLGDFLHSFIAFSFVITFTISFQYILINSKSPNALIDYSILAILIVIFLYFMASFGARDLFYYSGSRFSGLSKNPNQIAMVLSILPFYIMRSNFKVLYKAILFSVVMIVGVMTLSDGLFVSWLFAFLLLVTVISFERLNPILKFIVITASIFILLFSTLFLIEVFDKYYTLLNDGNQADVRFVLWKNGFLAFLESPIFGLGPGAHSGLAGPMQGSEAHNMFVDMLASFGLFSFVFYCFFIYVMWSLYKAKEYYLLAALASLLLFSVFHFTIRHPMFWFVLVTINVLLKVDRYKKCVE